MAVRTDDRRSPFGDTTGSSTQVKDLFPRGQMCACDHALDDRSKSLVDLPKVDIRDAVPDPDLPLQSFSVAF
jgi:hypothetical protein